MNRDGVAVTELLVAVLFLTRKPAERHSERAADWVVAFVGAFGALAARPGGAHSAAGDVAGLTMQLGGLMIVALGLGTLRRSFGLVAAQRDLVTGGPYRFVRHPLYAAYVVLQVGYLLQSLRLWNVAVFAITWACQVARIHAEERILRADDDYVRYAERTRFRLVPGLW